MQKKLIAAAVAGLIAVPALAQTNVTISGRLAAGWESYKLSDCAAGFSCRSESRVSDQSSRLIFNVNEDLGGGLSAWGQLDYRGALDMGGLGNTGNSGVGLAHKNWGKFTIGRWDVHYGEIEGAIAGNRAGSLQTLLGNGIMSQVSGQVGAAAVWSVVANGTRTPNLLMWDSPNWNGFTGSLAYSTNPAAIANEGSGVTSAVNSGNAGGGYAWTAAIRYNNGPWAAGYAHWSSESENQQEVTATGANVAAINNLRGDRIWLGYSFAMGLKLGFGYDWSRNDNGAAGAVGTTNQKRTAWYLPVSYSWGPHAVYASYARAGDTSNDMGLSTGASAWNIGYDYAFSKRTSMGIYYTALSNKSGGNYNLKSVGGSGATAIGSGAAGTTGLGADARQWYIGMAHSF